MQENKTIEIFTDGAAKGNPGNGGYGVLLRFNGKVKELSEGFRLTTNNRMELLAVIVGLEAIKSENYSVVITSDSKYVVDSITKEWIFSWQKKNFSNRKNADLWKRYISLHHKFNPKFKWIKGHNGHVENERCDQLAVKAAESKDLKIDEYYENECKNERLLH
jgi:ribonuclease HI